MANKTYDANSISVLEGLEAVRKRPGMYIGSVSTKGLNHLIYEIVDNSVDEFLAGYCDEITVSLNKDGTATITDNGRGIPVGINERTGKTAVEMVFTMLHAGGKFGDGGYKISGGLHGVGASVVNALSTWLTVTVKQGGKVYQQRYERGKIITPLEVIGTCRKSDTGTNVQFLPDPEIFVAIAIGMGIILLCMILNIINSARAHDTEKLWFDTNGAAGLVFYAALVSVIVLYMSGKALPATIVLVIMFVIPLAVIFFKEPLTAMVEKKSEKISGGVGMFITQGIFELFEVLLSYFSNTLSFVRVGAFAVSHAAMMQVVLMLAGAEAGDPNWGIVIGGNLFVCGMEGLIVGIQVLRLEYYELFSRFYRGSGRAFEPYGR